MIIIKLLSSEFLSLAIAFKNVAFKSFLKYAEHTISGFQSESFKCLIESMIEIKALANL